jgi:hypothetical protein
MSKVGQNGTPQGAKYDIFATWSDTLGMVSPPAKDIAIALTLPGIRTQLAQN